MQDNAAFVQYYLNISQSELKVFDKKVFCRPREDDTLEQIAKRYPKLSNISPVSMHNDVFQDFCTFIDNPNEEPNFGSLGAKYNLSGKSNGNSRTLQTRFAQSICYNMLVEARNLFPEKYTVAEKIVINEVQKRKGFEKLPLIENASFPRLPSKSEADKNVHSLISQGKLLLGDPQIPETIKTYDYKTHKDMVVHSCSRKNSIQTIKEFLLNEHVEHEYLRARKADYYDNLIRSEAIETLSRYGVYFDTDFRGQTAALPTGDLRQLVKITETTRHFLIWYDHSTIGGISYILFKPEIGFHISLFSNGESENTLTHLERISIFIVSNVKCGLKFMNYNHSSAIISFPYFETLVYPLFPIYSIFNSNIEHILLTKHRCFQEITKNCFQNGVLNVSKFIQFMLRDNNIQTVSANQDYTSSISLEPSLIGRQSYSTMLEKLSTVSDEPEGYGLLKHSSLTKCLAKIYGKTTPEVLNY